MMTNGKTVLVTGGCGFIGSHIVEALVKQGYRVRILDNLSTGKVENLNFVALQDIELYIGDVAELSDVNAAVAGCEYIFHEAAVVSVPQSITDPIATGKINYGGTLNILQAARQHGVRRAIFAGSAAVYGDEPTLPKKESMQPCPIAPYGVDKLASELMGHVYARNFGIEFVSLRYFNVFGSRQEPSSPYSGAISVFCDRMSQGIAPTIYGDGLQSRDFIHVSDVIRANLLVLKHPKAVARTFNVGRGIATNLLDVVNEINFLTNQNLLPIHVQMRPGDIRHSLADNTALKALGWSPLVSIREGLAELLKLKL
ncbi:NAD-dependent dehydratase [Chroococcidiopsis sp. CCALA 051]|uniref:NAD-dependent epimerase/dehydratase family protein n=1 Tax=Chroococcidiopsis sp. CCALA 051 TaxID=869949 RepID=UPI000D0D0A95|nr:NAD-dependent epimerase/dehydratase family protein [Chroococcidiopsis sp. CCALA 051]MBE9015941.1 NAD-dependent epimerase/dehydratase family protein [Chroococcidiopsidales cyanobacterium LEGE 13417]PSM48507.1 NAD-dependent dehydratase [Chroococcidiopsis sp. CCALA 051]